MKKGFYLKLLLHGMGVGSVFASVCVGVMTFTYILSYRKAVYVEPIIELASLELALILYGFAYFFVLAKMIRAKLVDELKNG